jgi:hypothetical protein
MSLHGKTESWCSEIIFIYSKLQAKLILILKESIGKQRDLTRVVLLTYFETSFLLPA